MVGEALQEWNGGRGVGVYMVEVRCLGKSITWRGKTNLDSSAYIIDSYVNTSSQVLIPK